MTSSPLELIGAAEQPGMVLVRYGTRYLTMSASAYHLYCAIEGGASVGEIAEVLSQRAGCVVPEDEITTAYQHVATQLVAVDHETMPLPRGFWGRWTCLPASLVNMIARWMAFFYHPVSVLVVAVLCLGIAIWSLPAMIDPAFLDLEAIEVTAFWPAYGLFLFSVLGHELGHASACRYFGVRPREIGFAFYWIYPVFYSNVNGAWQLSRWQRVVVDLGGLFFQGIIGFGYLAWYHATGSVAAHVALLSIVLTTIFTLNPVLKFDGYWVVADALNVPNLGTRIRQIIQLTSAKLRGRPAAPYPWSRRMTIMLAGLSLIWCGLFIGLLWEIIPVVREVLGMYPTLLGEIRVDLTTPPHQVSPERLQGFVSSTLLIISICLMLTLGSIRLLRWAQRRYRRTYPPQLQEI